MIDVARDFTKSREKLPGPEASTYPIVMDSPFGSLGSAYRTQVAEKITALADQVVLMVTPTHRGRLLKQKRRQSTCGLTHCPRAIKHSSRPTN